MPKVFDEKHEGRHLIVWKIEEDISFFASPLKLNKQESEAYNSIRFDHRKLEWMAARYVQRLLVEDSLIKDAYGKPHLNKTDGYISISHCKGFAAAIYDKKHEVGIDIEPIHEKILRIADKYTSQAEFSNLGEETKIAQLITNWSIKEAIYKKYGKRALNFKEHIRIKKYAFQDGETQVELVQGGKTEIHSAFFYKIENIMLAYV